MHIRAKAKPRSKELPVEIRGKIVSRHQSEEDYKKNSAILKVYKSM